MISVITKRPVKYINKLSDFADLQKSEEESVLLVDTKGMPDSFHDEINLISNNPNCKILVF